MTPISTGRIIAWSLLALFGVLVLSAALWALGVFASPVTGQGNAYKTKNSATNRIAAQERFEDMHANILAADKRTTVMTELVKADNSRVNQTNLAGAVTYCIDAVADYNAETRKYTASEWRAIDLPQQISDLDAATDCKDN